MSANLADGGIAGVKGAPSGRLKRSRASLIGGIGTGIGVFALTVALAGNWHVGTIILGIVLGGALAAWVRLADL
ncbi:MAG TPA: hypothetical protein VKY65_01635 [Alphaproteobacteria bacterium]|nr:hypothetical protein [Alphaproteobacteria bacterium]